MATRIESERWRKALEDIKLHRPPAERAQRIAREALAKRTKYGDEQEALNE